MTDTAQNLNCAEPTAYKLTPEMMAFANGYISRAVLAEPTSVTSGAGMVAWTPVPDVDGETQWVHLCRVSGVLMTDSLPDHMVYAIVGYCAVHGIPWVVR